MISKKGDEGFKTFNECLLRGISQQFVDLRELLFVHSIADLSGVLAESLDVFAFLLSCSFTVIKISFSSSEVCLSFIFCVTFSIFTSLDGFNSALYGCVKSFSLIIELSLCFFGCLIIISLELGLIKEDFLAGIHLFAHENAHVTAGTLSMNGKAGGKLRKSLNISSHFILIIILPK